MSFADRLVLWLHIAFAIFTVGPVALAISSTPRYIRRRDVPVLRYLNRITMIFTAASLLVLVFGLVLGQIDHAFGHPWLSVSLTLFVVAIVLLLLVVRDQRRAIRALAETGTAGGPAVSGDQLAGDRGDIPADQAAAAAHAVHIAAVERGRIAAIGGIVNVLWLVILVLMVWRP
ncbi:MAG: DUF2269 family protein [Streptosporangiaceae bacterium]